MKTAAKNAMNLAALILSIVFFFVSFANANVVYTNHTTMNEGRYKVWWTFVNATDRFYFKVEVEANGWIGFGITQLEYGGNWMRNGMDTYDVLVAGVYGNGSVYDLDYLTSGQNRSQYPDYANTDIHEWNITNAAEVGNKTILEFNRKRLTSEPVNTHVRLRKGHIQITPGLRYFVWAYHKTIDTPYLDSISLIHDRSGLEPVKLLPPPDDTREPVVITYAPPKADANLPVCSLTPFFITFSLILSFF